MYGKEYIQAIEEGSLLGSSYFLRTLFVIVLLMNVLGLILETHNEFINISHIFPKFLH